jgi:hypothetical protein
VVFVAGSTLVRYASVVMRRLARTIRHRHSLEELLVHRDVLEAAGRHLAIRTAAQVHAGQEGQE